MKRFLSTLLAVCMVLTLLPGTAWAAENSGSCGVDGDNISDNVTWQLDSTTGLLTISGTGNMRGYATGSPPWSGVKSVVIENGVTSVGAYSFYNERGGFNNLSNVIIPKSVTLIDNAAFYGCHGLNQITIPDSVLKIGQLAFAYCDGLTSVSIPSGVTTIEWETFGGCTNLTSVSIPSSVTNIKREAFTQCDSLTDVYYGGNASDWANIDIDTNSVMTGPSIYGNDALLNATIHYSSTGTGGAGEYPEPKEYKVYCNGSSEKFTSSLEECLATGSASSAYNPELAHMLIAMCNSVYSASDMAATFDSFGFQANNTLRVEGPFLTYNIGFKQLEQESLVLITVRGTGRLTDDFWSWASNANTSTDEKGQHKGFSDVTNDLYDKMMNFVDTRRSGDKITYVITGFSRGAAVTNLLAARLLNEDTPQSSLYAYAFACPDTIISTENLTGGYECIFNIADANDIVSWAPESLWFYNKDWNKYGQSYWFSDNWNDFENLEMGMDAHNQVKYLEYLSSPKTMSEYKVRSEAKRALDHAVEWRNDKFWTDVGANILSFIGIHCPVDVEIFASGQLVGSITNNMAQINDSTKVYIFIINDEKNIYLLDDDTYTLNLTATDTGTMEYLVQNIDVATKTAIDEQVFENVALTRDKEFTSVVTVEENAAVDVAMQEVKLYVIGSDGNPEKEVLPNGKGTEVPLISPNDAYTISFDTTVISVKVPSMKTGSDGKLSSLPRPSRSGYTFDGWFTAAIGGERITTETIFDCDTTIYAHWIYIAPSSSSSSGSSSSNSDPTYSITVPSHVTGGSVTVRPTGASEGSKVTITATPNSGYKVGTVTVTEKDGKKITVTDAGNGKYTFIMPKSRVDVNVEFVRQQTIPSFIDVQSGAYYADAVAWAVEKGITAGTSATTFSPDASCTRAQIVTFLWRAAGSPKATASSPFTDVPAGSYYYDAVLWAVEQGITSGTSTTMFSPDATCTRDQIVTFLWRAAGSPKVTASCPFTDVPVDSYYYDAMLWAMEYGITSGTSTTTFSPNAACTRAQAVTFLYRNRTN